jgi:hypothetical protein
LAFAANLFNKYPGIDVSKYDEIQKRALHEAEQRIREQVAREEEERRRRWDMEEQARQQYVDRVAGFHYAQFVSMY